VCFVAWLVEISAMVAPTWFGRLAILPLGIARRLDLSAAARAALYRVEQTERLDYRRSPREEVDFTEIDVPIRFETEIAVCITQLDRNELFVHEPNRIFRSGRTLGVARVRLELRDGELMALTKFAAPGLAFGVCWLVAMFGGLVSSIGFWRALVPMGLGIFVAAILTRLPRRRLQAATISAIDRFETHLNSAGRRTRVAGIGDTTPGSILIADSAEQAVRDPVETGKSGRRSE
jgi:hypothetical protein